MGMATKQYYDVCVKHGVTNDCYHNEFFPSKDTAVKDYSKPTDELVGDCSTGYCPCPAAPATLIGTTTTLGGSSGSKLRWLWGILALLLLCCLLAAIGGILAALCGCKKKKTTRKAKLVPAPPVAPVEPAPVEELPLLYQEVPMMAAPVAYASPITTPAYTTGFAAPMVSTPGYTTAMATPGYATTGFATP